MNEVIEYYKKSDFGENYEIRYNGTVGKYREKLIVTNFNSLLNFEKKEIKALEIGPGTGVVTFNFLKKFRSANLTCLDSSINMLNFLKRKLKKQNKKCNLILGDAKKLPFKDSSFDLIYSFRVLIHYSDFNELLNEMERVLKPNGIIVVDAHNLIRVDLINTFYRRFINPKGFKNNVESFYLFPNEIHKKYTQKNLEIEKIIGHKIIPPSSILISLFGEKNLLNFEAKFRSSWLKYFATDCYIKLRKKNNV